MRARISFTRLAKVDLDEIIAHIGEDDPKAAVSVSRRILDRIRLPHDQPELGRSGRLRETRELIVDGTRYIVAYRFDAGRAEAQILRILHSARRWPDTI